MRRPESRMAAQPSGRAPGDEPAPAPEAPSSDPEIARLAEARALAAGCWEAARRALYFARLYRFEEGPRGEREKACVAQAMEWRRSAKDAAAGRPVADLPRPGLARPRSPADADASTGDPASKRTA